MIRQLHLPPDYQILSFISYESYIWVKYVILWTSEYTDIFQEICLRDKIFSTHQVISLFFFLLNISVHTTREQKIGLFN